MEKIALFGTSADPPTAAHQTILRWLAEHFDLVAVWASDNPFKDHATSLEDRLKMLQILINEIATPNNNLELRGELSHRRSLHSVGKAQEIWGKNMEYYLVIGSDLTAQITQWYEIEKLLNKVKLLIVPRPDYPLKNEDLQALQKLGGEYFIAQLDVPDVSSTAYREKGKQEVITSSVKHYIKQEKLYS